MLFVVCLLGAAAYATLAGPFFRIRYIDARVPETSKAAVTQSVPLESNLLLFDPSDLEVVLAGDPLVDSVDVTKVLPDTVRVETVLREGVMRVQAGDKCLELDRKGVAFRLAVGSDLPLLRGVEGIERPGDAVPQEAIETALVWLDAAPRYSLPAISKVDYFGGGICNLVLDDGRLIKPGDTSEPDRKLAAAEAILSNWTADLEYLDVAVTTKPVVGTVPSEPPAEPADADLPGSVPSEAHTGEADDASDG